MNRQMLVQDSEGEWVNLIDFLDQLDSSTFLGIYVKAYYDIQSRSQYKITFSLEDVENALSFIGRVSKNAKRVAKPISAEVINEAMESGILTIPEDGHYEIGNQGVRKIENETEVSIHHNEDYSKTHH